MSSYQSREGSSPNDNLWSFSSAAKFTVAGGTISSPPRGWAEERCHQGLKLILLLAGSVRCELPGYCEQTIAASSLCMVLDEVGHNSVQMFEPAIPVRYVSIAIGYDSACDILGIGLDELSARAGHSLARAPFFQHEPAGRAALGAALQMLAEPQDIPSSRLFRSAKALELAAVVVERLLGAGPACTDLFTADRDRLHAARDMLLANLDDPPDLATLARRVGLNVRKLTSGFKALFGHTPASFVQETCLAMAHRMILSGEWTVSQAAWSVGYTPSAFSTAFRRRFGMPPSRLGR